MEQKQHEMEVPTHIDIEPTPPIVFTIHWNQIDDIIHFLSNRKDVLFDYQLQEYTVDGVVFTQAFLNEVVAKASHLINVISNVQLENKVSINHQKLQIKE